ncbi:alpha-galactosidase [Bombiscardovia nodaiensis]|uniref:Alpha-galactosidase n=1 Tax=Bombiscardovia nodaiensis TaxID=2932181 RepID=A0ABM8B6E8_9BIFI|nr:alpha-galactosidase [Bombiscardovia nodaiensis]
MTKAWRPPMGWNSWDSYGTTVNEQEVLANAQTMHDRLLESGWNTLVVDIAWYDPTARAHGYNENAPLVLDEYGRQLPDPQRFPSAADGAGFKPLADQIHALGLNFGIHVMRGLPRLAVERDLPIFGTPHSASQIADKTHVCSWNPDNYGIDHSQPGAQAWYDAQVDLFARWGVDYLKVDDMQTPFYSEEIASYAAAIEKAERAHGCEMILSLSPGGWVPTTHVDFLREHAQMWRISDDLWDKWSDVYQQFTRLARWAPLQRNGGWADADMLPLGHIGLRAERGDDRQSLLTPDEQRSLLTLWAMGRSPLMVGGDLPTSESSTLDLLANPALEEVTAGSQGNCEIIRERVDAEWGKDETYLGDQIVWKAQAADWGDGSPSAHAGGFYAALFWTGSEPREYSVALQSIVGISKASQPWTLANLWGGLETQECDARIEGKGPDRVITATLPAHGTAWLSLDPADSEE